MQSYKKSFLSEVHNSYPTPINRDVLSELQTSQISLDDLFLTVTDAITNCLMFAT